MMRVKINNLSSTQLLLYRRYLVTLTLRLFSAAWFNLIVLIIRSSGFGLKALPRNLR